MSIYKVSYLSNQLRVMGYLGIPPELPDACVLKDLAGLGVRIEETIALSFNPAGQTVATVFQATSEEPGNREQAYREQDGREPHNAKSSAEVGTSKVPAFIYCRGGIGRVGQVRRWWIDMFLRHQTIVFAPCYRGSEGSEGRDEFGGADVEDVLAAGRILRQLPVVDDRQISVMGFSRGSINATAAAVRDDYISHLILWGGVADLAQTYNQRVDLRRMLKRVVGGTPRRVEAAYQSRSPVAMAPDIKCPVLVMHGTADVQVDYSHGMLMATRLRELEHCVTIHSYERLGHHMDPLIFSAVIARMFDWIQQTPAS